MDMKQAMSGLALELTEINTQIPGQTEPAYYKPMTLGASDKIARFIKKKGVEGDGQKLAITVIQSVCDAEGKPLFTMGDERMLLQSVPQQILIDIVNEISSTPDIEAAEGN